MNVRQDIEIHQFILTLSSYLNLLATKLVTDKSKKINNANCIKKMCEYVLRILVYKKLHHTNVRKIAKLLKYISGVVYKVNNGRHFKRIRITPSTKWNAHGNRYIPKTKK